MDLLIQYLQSIHPLSAGLVEFLLENIKEKRAGKKEYLLKAGHVSRNIYFISKGILRCFYLKDDIEVCSWFMKEGDVIASVESFFNQTESYESIQALEDCELFYIDYNQLQYIYQHFPEFNFVGRVLAEKYYCLSEQRLYSLRMQRSQEKYDYMLEHFPELIQRVPSKYVSSYLGITEETLSRVRSKK
jgi:CRP/FNR family transcriptional regulator, anaerobic regulatory protein